MVTFGVTIQIPLAPQKRVVYADSSFFLFLFSVRVSEVMTNFFCKKNCHDGDLWRHRSNPPGSTKKICLCRQFFFFIFILSQGVGGHDEFFLQKNCHDGDL